MGEHCYLCCADQCYFAGEYRCTREPELRDLVFALKRGQQAAVEHVSQRLTSAIPQGWATKYTFVPMPRASSAINTVKLVLERIGFRDYRDLLHQTGDTPASHNGWRPSPLDRSKILSVNELLSQPRPSTIAVVDDVLTTGAHFRAAKFVLNQRWPEANVIGIFLARVCSRMRRCAREKVNPVPCPWGWNCPNHWESSRKIQSLQTRRWSLSYSHST